MNGCSNFLQVPLHDIRIFDDICISVMVFPVMGLPVFMTGRGWKDCWGSKNRRNILEGIESLKIGSLGAFYLSLGEGENIQSKPFWNIKGTGGSQVKNLIFMVFTYLVALLMDNQELFTELKKF